jgi:Gpi18-like mannosyltransferase
VGPDGAIVALPRGRPWAWRGSRLEAAWLAYRFPILVYLSTRLALVAMALVESQVRHHAFTGELSNWDGMWYRALAATGYPHHPYHFQTTLGFLPGYSLLMWPLGHLIMLLGLVPPSSTLTAMSIAGIIISGIGGLVAAILIQKLAEGWWGESASRRAVILFCLFPGSVVFSMVYSEGVMLPLAIGCILALQRRRWLLGGILAGLATTTEPDAFVLIPVCIAAALLELRRYGWRDRVAWRSLLAPILSVTGVVAVGAFLWAWTGTPLASYHAQHYGWREKTDPLALVHLTKNLFAQVSFSHFNNPPIDMNLVVGFFGAILLIVLLVLLARSWRSVSIEALVWTAGIAFLAVTSEYVPPNPRLLFTAFPAILVLARYVKGKAFWLLAAANGALLLGLSWWTLVGVGLRP